MNIEDIELLKSQFPHLDVDGDYFKSVVDHVEKSKPPSNPILKVAQLLKERLEEKEVIPEE